VYSDKFNLMERRVTMTLPIRALMALLLISGLVACTNTQAIKGASANACIRTEPFWVKPPEDSAVLDPPAYSYYFVNKDRSILASASWATVEKFQPTSSKEWIKVGWFRPEGAELKVTGQRLDGEAPPLEFEAPCCYPTRFQASGLYFPTEGCWEVTARAADKELSFVVWIEP
jgi:hypothetical protein